MLTQFIDSFFISLKIFPPIPWVGIRNISDYSPFGVLLPERTVEGTFYRNGFQGQERDDEVKGEGNSVNYSYRMHDPRVGRFFAVDALSERYPWYSPYCFSGNMLMNALELEGLEPVVLFGYLVGYLVKEGQGPSQVAADINNPATQKKYGFSLTTKVTYLDIVYQNIQYFKYVENPKDANDDGYKHLNMNQGDALITPITAIKEIGNDINEEVSKYLLGILKVLDLNIKSNDSNEKSFIDYIKEYERWIGTESEGSSHGSDVIHSGDGGKFSVYDPFDGWLYYEFEPYMNKESWETYGKMEDGTKLVTYHKIVSGFNRKGEWVYNSYEITVSEQGELLYQSIYENGEFSSQGDIYYEIISDNETPN